MIYYAIRRKTDGAFMPQGRLRGFTHDMPSLERPPRLFTTRAAANSALSCWLMGEWTQETDVDGEVWPAPPANRPKDRRDEDMEVVVVRLEVP